MKQRRTTVPHVPKEFVAIWLRMAHPEQAVSPLAAAIEVPLDGISLDDIPPLEPGTPPRRVVELALEQIRAFINIQGANRVANDGSVSRIDNAEMVVDIVEGFLDYLLNRPTHPVLADLAEEIQEIKQTNLHPHTRLNDYIHVLRSYHAELPAEADVAVAELARAAEQALIDEALVSPHLTQLPNGELVGNAGTRFEKMLLQTAVPWLERIARAATGSDRGLAAETLLEKARNAATHDHCATVRMPILNQVLSFWQTLSAPLAKV